MVRQVPIARKGSVKTGGMTRGISYAWPVIYATMRLTRRFRLFDWSDSVLPNLSPSRRSAGAAVLTLALAAVSASAAGAASTLSPSPTINVSATVANNCTSTVTQPSTMTYDPIVTNSSSGTNATSATGALVVTCTKNDAVTIDLDKGLHSTGTSSPYTRNMLGSASTPDSLPYQIYSDAYTTVWGSTTGGSTVSVTGAGPSSSITKTLYISIPKGANVKADSYTDTVTATVTY